MKQLSKSFRKMADGGPIKYKIPGREFTPVGTVPKSFWDNSNTPITQAANDSGGKWAGSDLPGVTVRNSSKTLRPIAETVSSKSDLSTTAPTTFAGKAMDVPNTFVPKEKGPKVDLSEVVPFASNIANIFRRAPKPTLPNLNSAQKLQKINMDDARNQVGREISASNTGADRSLDSNTAASIKLFNSGRKFNELSKINEYEKNANAGISNQQAQMDYQAQVGNNAKMDQYNNDILEGKIADSANQSANFANVSDKFVAIGNEKAKRKLDMDKTKILSTMFSKDGPSGGVFGRARAAAYEAGADDPLEGRKLTPQEYAGIKTTPWTPPVTNNTVPPVSSMTPVTNTQDNSQVPVNTGKNYAQPKIPPGYPYNNTKLPDVFNKPIGQQFSVDKMLNRPKFKMGGQMKKVKY